jgi:hypothetical protein
LTAALGILGILASGASASIGVHTGSAEAGAYAATLGGYVTGNEFARVGIQYGTTTEYGSETPYKDVELAEIPSHTYSYTAKVEGLQPNTTYHFQLAAVTRNGVITYGEDQTFTTTGETKFQADQYPATVNAAQEASSRLTFGFEGEPLTCSTATGLGLLNEASATLSLAPNMLECEGFSGLLAAVRANSCSLTFHAGDVGFKDSTMGISCPEGKSLEINAGTCALSIPAQSGLVAVEAVSRGTSPASLQLKLSVTHLRYVKTKDGFLCRLNGTGTVEDGTVTGNLIVTATNSLSQPIGIQIK